MRKFMIALLLILVFFSFVSPVSASQTIRVFYSGDSNSNVRIALGLAPEGTITFVDDAIQADVIVLNGNHPQTDAIAKRLKEGVGLVWILGESTSPEEMTALLEIPVELTKETDAVSLTHTSGVDDLLLREIIWNSAPQIRERYKVVTPGFSIQPLVNAYETGEWILGSARGGRVFVFNGFLDGVNPQIQEWAYFNYLIYHMVVRAAGQTPYSFAEYPASPVPHETDRNILWTVMGLIVTTTVLAFIVVRRYSLRHPEELDNIVSNHARFEKEEQNTDWEQVGFHRPLGGFMVALAIGLILFIPLIVYQNLILPVYILPSAEALGIWGRVTQFFNLAWQFFDMGTSIAFIKYLSQYRVHDPRKGIQYGQVFVWWQALSGAVQVAIVVGLASSYAPKSA